MFVTRVMVVSVVVSVVVVVVEVGPAHVVVVFVRLDNFRLFSWRVE